MRKPIVAAAWVGLAIVLLGGLYAGLYDRDDDGAPAGSGTFELTIPTNPKETDSRPLEEFPVFKIRQGETVSLIAHAAAPGTIHVHIYEKDAALLPGGDVTLTFPADVTGRFPIHLHDPDGAMHHLATLEVRPR